MAICYTLPRWDDKDTKSNVVSTGSFPANTYLGVIGYLCENGTWTGEETPYFYNTQLNTDGTYYSDNDIEYWMERPSTMRFFAYFPYEVQSDDGGTPEKVSLTGITAEGLPYLIYTMPLEVTGHVDLLGAKTDTLNTPGEDVPLNFNHLLSKIKVYAKIDASTPNTISLIVDTLRILNLYTRSRYDVEFEGWDSYSQRKTFDFLKISTELSSTSFVDMLEDYGGNLLIIPQPLSTISIVGKYTVINNAGSEPDTTHYTKSRSLYGMSELTCGKSLSFYFNFNPNLNSYLDIDISIKDWADTTFTTVIN